MEAYLNLIDRLKSRHENDLLWPSVAAVSQWVDHLLDVLFQNSERNRYSDVETELNLVFAELTACLVPCTLGESSSVNSVVAGLKSRLPELYNRLLRDAEAIEKGDPAAVSQEEVIRTYPGFLAIAHYRLAHELMQEKVLLIPRMITELAHGKTGIDIHPNAIIGEGFFIDHGTGIVIGETTVIGNQVKIYQGVTLGALSVQKELASVKRHPTIEDRAVIYAGATILGGETTIGHDSIIGGNTWITQSVEAHSLVTHTAEITIKQRSNYVKTH